MLEKPFWREVVVARLDRIRQEVAGSKLVVEEEHIQVVEVDNLGIVVGSHIGLAEEERKQQGQVVKIGSFKLDFTIAFHQVDL